VKKLLKCTWKLGKQKESLSLNLGRFRLPNRTYTDLFLVRTEFLTVIVGFQYFSE
jgi:hypothetical protein